MSKVGARPPIERMAVRIDTVDLPNRIAHVISKRDGKFKAGFRAVDSLFQIPLKGETWIVERHTSYEWNLVSRQDRPAEHDAKNTLAEGDAHMRVPGKLLIDTGSGLQLLRGGATSDIGATTNESRTTTGSTTTWTLANTPVNLKTVMLFDNGLLVDPATLSLAGKVLTFASIATGHALVVYYQI